MTRLTRSESQARTRETLLETAKACFLRDGYIQTSLEAIADTAGYSKGAVYSNFRNKDELCLAVIDAVRHDRIRSLADAVTNADGLDARIDAFETWAERTLGDREWTSLEVEFAVHAARDAKLSAELLERDRAVRASVVSLVELHASAEGIELPMPADQVASALLGLGVGLGVQRAIDPTLSVHALPALLRLLVGRKTDVTEPARTTSKRPEKTLRGAKRPRAERERK
jgi:AcrR family transcriptional regulator